MRKGKCCISLLIYCVLSICTMFLFAQKKNNREPVLQVPLLYKNWVYNPAIRSVQLYNKEAENSFPIIRLNSDEQLLLSFDDLRPQAKNIYYSIEHCDANWQSSGLMQMDYLDGFPEDRINDFWFSNNTFQKYTHFELSFPTRNMRMRIAGNYLLKVYDDADSRRLLLTRRFFVVNPLANIEAKIIPSLNATLRNTHQQTEITIKHPGLSIQNPYMDIKVLCIQNNRPDIVAMSNKPTIIKDNELGYKSLNNFNFLAGNEFRILDIRSLRTPMTGVSSIDKDSTYVVRSESGSSRADNGYITSIDNNGRFSIRNMDFDDARLGGDYARVIFQLKASSPPQKGNVYVVGQFNDFRQDEQSIMSYDAGSRTFRGMQYLKQGVYDYEYIWVNSDREKVSAADWYCFEGSFFETRNTYQVLVYYRRPGNRWDELIAYTDLKN